MNTKSYNWLTLYMESGSGERHYLLHYSLGGKTFDKLTDGMTRRHQSASPEFLLVGYMGHETMDDAMKDGNAFAQRVHC